MFINASRSQHMLLCVSDWLTQRTISVLLVNYGRFRAEHEIVSATVDQQRERQASQGVSVGIYTLISKSFFIPEIRV